MPDMSHPSTVVQRFSGINKDMYSGYAISNLNWLTDYPGSVSFRFPHTHNTNSRIANEEGNDILFRKP
jgi:hypothetical protein